MSPPISPPDMPYTTACRPEEHAHFFPSHQRTCYCGQETVPDRSNKDLYGLNCFLFAKQRAKLKDKSRNRNRKAEIEVSTDVVDAEAQRSFVEDWLVQKDRDLLRCIGLKGHALDSALKDGT